MEFFRVYGRVIGLLRAEKGLAITLAIANIAVAGLQFYEPVLFGKVIDLLSNARDRPVEQLWHDARYILGLWALVGLGGIVANMVVSLQADRMAHRRRLGAMATYSQHLLMLPFSFHNAQHSGRLIKIMLTGVDNLFGKAYAEHLNLAGNAGFGYPANDPQAIKEPGRTLWTKVDMSF